MNSSHIFLTGHHFSTAAEPDAILTSVQWVQELLVGPLAVSVAVIAVASIGFIMLRGRIDLRRGASILIGCFIVFGASTIAAGIKTLASPLYAHTSPSTAASPPLILAPPPPVSRDADPYAGAALRRRNTF